MHFRLLLHAKFAANTHPGCRVVIQSPDTDVLVISVYHFRDIGCREMWFKTGVKDHLRYIPVHAVYGELGGKMCQALPAFHAITGCDSTSSFAGVTKKKGWQVLSKSEVHQDSLTLLGVEANLSDAVAAKYESFVCNLYRVTKQTLSTADELRYLRFCQKPKNETLPPTSDSLLQHLKRANYQTLVWKQALAAVQNLPDPEGSGWVKEGSSLKPQYMTKQPAPTSLLELTKCSCKTGCEGNCSCKNTGLSCSEACYCMGSSDICRNPHRVLVDMSGNESNCSDSE